MLVGEQDRNLCQTYIWDLELCTREHLARITLTPDCASITFSQEHEMARDIVLHDQCHVLWMEEQTWISQNIFATNWTVADVLWCMPMLTARCTHCFYIKTVSGATIRVQGKVMQAHKGRTVLFPSAPHFVILLVSVISVWLYAIGEHRQRMGKHITTQSVISCPHKNERKITITKPSNMVF